MNNCKQLMVLLMAMYSGLASAQLPGLSAINIVGEVPVVGSLLGGGALTGSFGKQPLPIVNELMGSDVFNQVLSGGVPGLDLLLDNPAAASAMPLVGGLLDSVSVADILVGAAKAAP